MIRQKMKVIRKEHKKFTTLLAMIVSNFAELYKGIAWISFPFEFPIFWLKAGVGQSL